MENKDNREIRYIVSVGTYKDEKAALTRQAVARQAGLSCEIIDTKDDSLSNIETALLLIAEQLAKITSTEPAKTPENKPGKIGQLIRQKRTEKQFTQRDLGVLLGVNDATVSAWEYGYYEPPKEQMERIKIALGIKPEELK